MKPISHKVFELEYVNDAGWLQIVRNLTPISGQARFRDFCMKNYWNSKKPVMLGFQFEGEREFFHVIPHAFSGRPSLSISQFWPVEPQAK